MVVVISIYISLSFSLSLSLSPCSLLPVPLHPFSSTTSREACERGIVIVFPRPLERHVIIVSLSVIYIIVSTVTQIKPAKVGSVLINSDCLLARR